jgi:glycosyltransferase involved in cell wall biosynthesis/uncharacterized heparinase superfamily protein
MHIVFFSHYYPPEVNAPASRTSEHCREWVRQGHDVTVVTCAPNHPSGKVYPSYRNRLYQTEWIDGVHVIRLWTFLAANEGFLLRTLNYVSYLVAVVLALPTLRRPDVIVSTSPQFFCGLAGLAARFIKRAPWVLEIRDLWPESIVTVGAMRRNWCVRLLEALEAHAYRRADRIVSLTQSFVPHIAERAGNPAKIAVITNGVDVSHFKAATDRGNTKRELGLDEKFVAAYVGTHGMAHGLETILEAAALLRDQPRIAFLLVGDGAERSRIERLKQERRLDNVLILGQRSKEAMPSIWAATDASLILLRRNELFRKVIPSKMFEAMAMRRPIVLAVEGEARALLKEAGAGIAITPESAQELAAAVARLADDPAFAAGLGASGAEHAREHYDRARLASRYLALLEETRGGFSPALCDGAERGQGINRWMMSYGPLHRAARAIAFGRHMPITKLARRLELDVRRRLHDRLGSFRFGSKHVRRWDFVHLSPAGRGGSEDKVGGSGEGGLSRTDRAQPLTRHACAFQPLPLGEVKGTHAPRLLRIFTQDVSTSVAKILKAGARTQGRALERAAAPPGPLLQRDGGHVEVRGDVLRFSFLGRTETMPRSAIDWQAPCPGPAHQLWRMNLHYMAYLKDVPDSLWREMVTSWIEANEPYRPGAWKDAWNSYALSLRVVEWMQELVRRAGRLPSGLVARVEASLALQLLFLERNLETDIGGNHLMKNIRALIWASAFFAGVEAARWRAKGVKLLESELERQILGDGMHFERSPSYHCQVFADLLEICYALGNDPFGGRLRAALAQMAAVVTDLTHPDGRVALFNDAGLSMAEMPGACLEAYERLFAPRPAPRAVFALKEAGYHGLRSDDSYLIVDCGRIAPDDLTAHGHGDVLSFEWSVAGQRLIVDQGVFEYVAGSRRQAARSAANHNTLCFAGADQANFFGAFRCGRRPNVEVLEYAPRADGFALAGTHDGFRHLPGRPRHVRRFEARRREILIQDRIEGRSDRAASIGFLLHPGAHVEVSGHEARIVCRAAKIEMLSTLPICVEQAVWWPDMGCEHATHRLRIDVAPGVREVQTTLRVIGHT